MPPEGQVVHEAKEEDQLAVKFQTRLTELTRWFTDANPGSAAEAAAAAKVLPGGNTRTVLHQSPFPIVLVSGRGPHVTSKDGQECLDFVSEYSAAMYGHSHPAIHEAVHEALSIGMNLGSVVGKEAELGRHIQIRFPSMELLRYTNSGTEANTLALAAALAHSGKHEILVFKNGYHGSTLSFPGGENPPTNLPHNFVIGTFNDIEATQPLLHHGIGAILVEPLQSSGGVIPAKPEFLKFLRETATSLGAVLIFDEVVTSRLHYHGLQGLLDIKPDMTTLGKYMGGGFSFGCFGGRQEIMAPFDPRKPNCLTHSGTYNNNIFTMTAGIAGQKLVTPEEIARINSLGDEIRSGINKIVETKGLGIWTSGYGSAIGLHYPSSLDVLRDVVYFELLKRNILVARRGYIMMNLAHTSESVIEFLKAFTDVIESLET